MLIERISLETFVIYLAQSTDITQLKNYEFPLSLKFSFAILKADTALKLH